jgi:YidC/Oxa1 family membrane protein insertase
MTNPLPTGNSDKRTAFAVVLSIFAIMAYMQMFVAPANIKPDSQTVNTIKQNDTSNNINDNSTVNKQNPAEITTSQTNLNLNSDNVPTTEEFLKSPKTTVDVNEVQYEIAHLGARLVSAKLNKFKRKVHSKYALNLVNLNLPPLALYFGKESDRSVKYDLISRFGSDNNKPMGFTFSGTTVSGAKITKTFTFSPTNGYLFAVSAKIENRQDQQNDIILEWSEGIQPTDPEATTDPWGFTLLNAEEDIEHIPVANATGIDYQNIKWGALGNKYFIGALIGKSAGNTFRLNSSDKGYTTQLIGKDSTISADVYVGPKDPDILTTAGSSLERAIDLGFFAFVAKPLLQFLNLLFRLLGNYGLAIVALTLIIKTLLLPLAKKTFTSMQAMQDLQPEMKRIQERYADDQTKLQQEIFALYKKKGVNPFGGCIPTFLQIPIFLGLYNALLNSINLRHAPFALWIDDLSVPESLFLFGIPIPVMILLMGGTMIAQQWLQPSSADPQQKKMMMIMPFIFTGMFIIIPMPSGLVLYWLVNNLISIIQQTYLKSHKKASPLVATLTASAGIFALTVILTLI